MKITIIVAAILISLTAVERSLAADDEEHVRSARSSDEFRASRQAAIKQIATDEFNSQLRSPTIGSLPADKLEALIKEIENEESIPGVATGDFNVVYDVILQPGHYLRPPGAVGTAGERVSERALVAFITRMVASKLKSRGHNVLVISADHYLIDDEKTPHYEGLTAKAFLSIHADGSVKPCKSGPSLGYREKSAMPAMHQLALAVAIALGYSYRDYENDNFTVNLSNYYMLRKLKTKVVSGILEVGELTCPKSEKAMIEASEDLAANIATALHFIVSRTK